MARQPVPFTSFGKGLNLVDAPGLVDFDWAVDALNVTFSRRGSVKQRGGYAAFSGLLTNQPDSLSQFYKAAGTKRLLVGNGSRIDVLDTAGTSVANTTAPTASPHYFTRFGGPTIEAIYVANGTDQVRRYDTTGGFTTPAGLAGQTGKFLAVTPTSNRLVVARESGTTAGNNPSSVNFSNAGAPETFTATSFIDLDPGDGDAITGIIPWESQVLIFKERKTFVHWGESTDSTGLPVFEVRKADSRVGLVAPRAVSATPFGVFFLSRDGVYLYSGGQPRRVTDNIEPFFTGDVPIYFQSQPINQGAITAAASCWHDNRLYIAVPTGGSTTNNAMLVHDPAVGWWSLYDMPAAAMVSFEVSSSPELVFARSDTSKTVGRHQTGAASYSADEMTTAGTGGSAITSRWRSGWSDAGSPAEKEIHQMELYGTGSCTVTAFQDFRLSDAANRFSQAVTFTTESSLWDVALWDSGIWGPSATITRKVYQKGYPATRFGLRCSNSTLNTSWELNAATFFVTGSRPPGFKD